MKLQTRSLLVVLALTAANLACNLPVWQETSNSPLFPQSTQTPGAVAQATDLPVPTRTLVPVKPTFAPSYTWVASRTAGAVTSTPQPVQNNPLTPTPPSTITISAKSATPVTPANAPALSRSIVFAPRFNTPPVLDGLWDEWKDRTTEYPAKFLVYGNANWSGTQDLEGSYRVAWDNTYLYLSVKVKDDIYAQNATGNNLYEGDSIELLLDTQLFDDLNSKSLSPDDYQIGISPGREAVEGEKEAYLWFPRGRTGPLSDVEISSARQEGITRYEVAIPWTIFEIRPTTGLRLGFALSVSDNDDVRQNIQESMVSSVSDRSLVDPTTWGELRLK